MSDIVLPRDSSLYRKFAELAAGCDLVFFAGLPGVGKSLLLQQLALLARERGRTVHLLQWDVARQPFESPRYPLRDGATHPLVIRAVGTWARGAVLDWQAAFGAGVDMLIGELPLIGGRLLELAQPMDDRTEDLLRGPRARFVLPLPSREVRRAIEAKRERTILAPRHDNEAHDAPPDLLRSLWQDLYRVAFQLGMVEAANDAPYSPAIYAAVYRHLLSRRTCLQLDIDQVLPAGASAYAGLDGLPNLCATQAEAERVLTRLEAQESPSAARAWFEI